jgi:serine/threonine protein kinase
LLILSELQIQDVKSQNALVTKDFKCKLSVFGLSRLEETQNSTFNDFKGTMPYACPESLSGKRYIAKSDVYASDVWQFGVLIKR